MKLIKKTLTLLLSLCILFSAFAVMPLFKRADAASPNTYLVENGVCEYSIVAPANRSGDVDYAVTELFTLFKEATGISLPILDDTNRIFKASSKYISVGNTTLFMQTGETLPNSLGENGVYIKTVEKSVFINGADETGVLYAVYDFLSLVFDYEFYGREAYKINKNVDTLKLLTINYNYTPSFASRAAGGYDEMYNTVNVKRLRHVNLLEPFLATGINKLHNSVDYVKDAISGHENYWIAQNGSIDAALGYNLCYNARGNATEKEALLEQVTSVVKDVLRNDLNKKWLNISLMDNVPVCNCSTCQDIEQTYGFSIASDILFCNEVRARVQDWFESEEGIPYARDFSFNVFAYMGSEHAPVVLNSSTGKYEGKNGLECADGVGVFYAPIYHDYTSSLYDTVNKDTLKNLQGWSAIADNLFVWFYDMNYQDYFTSYDTFNYKQELLQFTAGLGNVEYVHFQGQQWSQSITSTGWQNLHVYLNAKLQWNVNADVDALTRDFFENFYGPAADIMFDIFNQTEVHYAYLRSNFSDFPTTYSCETSIIASKHFSQPLLTSWINKFQEAYDAIEYLKKDFPELYEDYFYRIATEEVSPLYIILKLYKSYLNSDTLAKYVNDLKTYTADYGFVPNGGGLSVSYKDIWVELGIE